MVDVDTFLPGQTFLQRPVEFYQRGSSPLTFNGVGVRCPRRDDFDTTYVTPLDLKTENVFHSPLSVRDVNQGRGGTWGQDHWRNSRPSSLVSDEPEL